MIVHERAKEGTRDFLMQMTPKKLNDGVQVATHERIEEATKLFGGN